MHETTRHVPRVGSFFSLTFAWTWSLQIPAVLAQRGHLPGDPESYLPLAALGILGPGAAALWLTGRNQGSSAARHLLASVTRLRASLPVYVIGMVLPMVLLSAGLLLLRPAGYDGPLALTPTKERVVIALLISLAEELGFRGYALPRLHARYGALAASAALSVLWTLWHIPMFVGQGIPLSLLPVLQLELLGGSILFTWIYLRSRGGLGAVVLAHFCIHLNNPHLALPDNTLPLLLHSVIVAGLGLAVARFDRQVFPELARRSPHRALP